MGKINVIKMMIAPQVDYVSMMLPNNTIVISSTMTIKDILWNEENADKYKKNVGTKPGKALPNMISTGV